MRRQFWHGFFWGALIYNCVLSLVILAHYFYTR